MPKRNPKAMPSPLASRLRPCVLLVLAALGCPADPEGDDLPPGAFTSGGDDVVDPTGSDGATSVDPGDTTTTTSPTTTSTPDTDADATDTAGMVSHDADIQPIWNAYCTGPSCHDADGPQGNLDLQSAGARDRLCGANSTTQTSIRLVDCDGLDPEASWLWSKVTGEGLELPGAGSLMPVGLPMLTAGELATIEAWISGGALP
jgi:hypothetical protein